MTGTVIQDDGWYHNHNKEGFMVIMITDIDIYNSGKSLAQSEQIRVRLSKYFKHCCPDMPDKTEIPNSVIDYCLGCVTHLESFVELLSNEWNIGFSGSIGYMNAISHALDFRRTRGVFGHTVQAFIMTEIYVQRVKRSLSKKMRTEWKTLLSIEYLDSINCWATLEDLEKVIPYHSDRYKQVIRNCEHRNNVIPPHDLSFSTSFVVSIMFLLVKASRPMTYQFLTVNMVKSITKEGFIDQTVFKTNDRYGYDTLMFCGEALMTLRQYILLIRPRFNPKCPYVFVCRNGTQLSKLTEIFGKIVYQAIGKYIHPTRYRQIIETASASNLSMEEQRVVSANQKHTSHVAQVHYQKLRSRDIAKAGANCMERLTDYRQSRASLANIGLNLPKPIDFNNENSNESEREEPHVEDLQSNVVHTPHVKEGERNKKVPFSKEEDTFLALGISKHGKGKWTAILNDENYSFHKTRKPSTLHVRAKLKKII